MIESGWRVSLHAFSHPKCSLLPPPTKCKYLHHISTAAAASSSKKTNAASQTVDDDDDDDNDCVQQQKQQEQGLRCERDVRFAVGKAFYRSESSLGRDLGVLAAAAHKLEKGSLRVLDAMCGCGVRAMRYIMHSGADFVLANDACKQLHPVILQNLERCSVIGSTSILTQSHCLTDHILTAESSNWKVTHVDANRLLLSRYLANDYFDLIDVDSFGSSSVCLRSALAAVRHGGLLYVTSTDGVSSGGRRPYNALAAYGAFVRQMPYCNEIGLRMLIGGVIRDAAMRNLNVSPLFSYYSYHGPVFRVMLRVRQGKLIKNMHYGFIAYCRSCGSSQTVQWEDLGNVNCTCSQVKAPSLIISGPLWTGPLHSVDELQMMWNLAREWGWLGSVPVGTGGQLMVSESEKTANAKTLDQLLEIMIEESQPALPAGFIDLPEISKRGKIQTPRRNELIKLIQKDGYAASRSHVEPNALKTNCPFFRCLELAKVLVC